MEAGGLYVAMAGAKRRQSWPAINWASILHVCIALSLSKMGHPHKGAFRYINTKKSDVVKPYGTVGLLSN